MTNFSSTSRMLIVVSVLSTLMVFWLGSRHISDALVQYHGANQLRESVTPEAALFETANRLNLERAEIQRTLTSSAQYDDREDRLNKLASDTQSSFETARNELSASLGDSFLKLQYQYSEEDINKLLDEIAEILNQLRFSRIVIKGQIDQPNISRQEELRMQLYDTYVNLIEDVNKLRKQTHAYPHESYVRVISAYDAKNSVWNISEAFHQISILIESFLLKYQHAGLEYINFEYLKLRVFQQQEIIRAELSNLPELLRGENYSPQLQQAVDKIKTQYEAEFQPQARQIILSVPLDENLTALPAMTQNWVKITNDTEQNIKSLQSYISMSTETHADSLNSSARLRLLFSTFLVSLCMVTAFVSFKLAKRIQHQADHDELTNLPNRRFFNEALKQMFRKVDISRNEKLALLTLDLNGFKSVNDTLGHSLGDRLLAQVAQRLTNEVDENTFIARMGGDEFSVAYNFKDQAHVEQLAQRMKSLFDESFTTHEGLVKLGVSIGYSVYPDDAQTVQDLQTMSDFAMFNAKHVDNITIQSYDHKIAEKHQKRIQIEQDLASAIEEDGLELYYQPQVDLKNRRADAVEALLRWNHPTRGMVSPFEFISVAEETGQMPAIGNWVLNEACRQIAIWNNQEKFQIRVAVNVSVQQIAQTQFVENVLSATRSHGIDPAWLELEITESVVMSDISKIVSRLNTLKEHGFRIALDDFGTGYSSLSQLEQLPLDTLKIDRSFIQKLCQRSDTRISITATIAAMAKVFELETVAEGIETEQQLEEVKKLGIDIAQGYYYSKPVSRHQVIDTLMNIDQGLDADQKAA